MNTDAEEILDKYCNNQFNDVTGEEEILSSKSSVLFAMIEYAQREIDSSEKVYRLERILAQTECPHYYESGHIVRYCDWCLERNKLLK